MEYNGTVENHIGFYLEMYFISNKKSGWRTLMYANWTFPD